MDLPQHSWDAHQKGRLLILAGPSGVGKSSIVQGLLTRIPHLYFSISVTTRSPRIGERNGVDYFFVSPEEFDDLIDHNQLLEWAWIHGGLQRSGTPLQPVIEAYRQERPILIEVDLAGMEQIKHHIPWAKSVFLMPPNWHELKNRLAQRGSETNATLARRLKTARWEMIHANTCDYVIINENIDNTIMQIENILTALPSSDSSLSSGNSLDSV